MEEPIVAQEKERAKHRRVRGNRRFEVVKEEGEGEHKERSKRIPTFQLQHKAEAVSLFFVAKTRAADKEQTAWQVAK